QSATGSTATATATTTRAPKATGVATRNASDGSNRNRRSPRRDRRHGADAGARMPLSHYVGAGRNVLHGVGDDALLTRAAAIAFSSALSFAPLMVLLLWLLAALRPEWQQQVTAGLARILGEKAAGAIDLVVGNAKSTPTLGNIAGI